MEKTFISKTLKRHPLGNGGADAMVRHQAAAGGPSTDADTRFRLLRLLAQRPESSQRAIALELGIALGRVNLLLRGLVEAGLVHRRPIRAAGNRPGQGHWPTREGLAEAARLARGFLARKRAEQAALAAEIAGIEAEFAAARRGTSAWAGRGA